MGHWILTIHGDGPHHNGKDFDIEALAAKFVREISGRHTTKSAEVVCNEREKITIPIPPPRTIFVDDIPIVIGNGPLTAATLKAKSNSDPCFGLRHEEFGKGAISDGDILNPPDGARFYTVPPCIF